MSAVKVRIRNYQSVEDLEIEVSGFTCVTGKSNIGKSAIMRAISSAILDDPVVGKVRKGASFCTVELSSDGWGFTWEKGERGVNRYTIGGKVYDKVGQSQLPEVASMGFGSIRVGDDEIQPWWASQFSPLFLLNRSGAQVTGFISEVSRLTVLQNAIILSARMRKTAADAAKGYSEEASRLREKAARVAALDQVEPLHRDLEEQAKSVRAYEQKIAAARALDRTIAEARRKIGALEPSAGVSLPSAYISGDVDALTAMAAFWRALEGAAEKVIAMKGAGSVSVPSPPEAEHSAYTTASRFAGIPALRASVESLSRSAEVQVPSADGLAEEVARAGSGARALRRVGELSAAIARLSGVPGLPADPGVGGAIAEVRALARAADLQSQVRALVERAEETRAAYEAADKELASIPSCPECRRPVAEEHRHL